jgi:hypothetical protein
LWRLPLPSHRTSNLFSVTIITPSQRTSYMSSYLPSTVHLICLGGICGTWTFVKLSE